MTYDRGPFKKYVGPYLAFLTPSPFQYVGNWNFCVLSSVGHGAISTQWCDHSEHHRCIELLKRFLQNVRQWMNMSIMIFLSEFKLSKIENERMFLGEDSPKNRSFLCSLFNCPPPLLTNVLFKWPHPHINLGKFVHALRSEWACLHVYF